MFDEDNRDASAESTREESPIEAFANVHMDHCAECSDGKPCNALARIIGAFWR